MDISPYKPEQVHAYAKWLTLACQRAGLDAAQYGAEIVIQGPSNHLSERITCEPDEHGDLRWLWSWRTPITDLRDPARTLTPDDVDDLVIAIKKVVSIPRPRR